MADTWEKIFRQVAIGANLMASSVSSTLASNYTTAAIGQAQLTARAAEFSKEAIDDYILSACDVIIFLIGNDPQCQYRPFFHDVTANISSGSTIPVVGSGGSSRIGKIGAVRDSSDQTKLKFKTLGEVNSAIALKSTIVSDPYWYYTDYVRIWHTVTNVVADVVVYNKSSQRTLMGQTPNRGICPFPEDLHEMIVEGALSRLFKGAFNIEQSVRWAEMFRNSIAMKFGDKALQELEARKVLE